MPQNNWCDVTASARSPVRQSTYYTLHRQSRDAISDATRERVGAARAPHRHTHDGRGTEIPKKVTAALCTPRQLIHGRNERAGLHHLRGEDHAGPRTGERRRETRRAGTSAPDRLSDEKKSGRSS